LLIFSFGNIFTVFVLNFGSTLMLAISYGLMFGSLGISSLLHMFLLPGSACVEEQFEPITEGEPSRGA